MSFVWEPQFLLPCHAVFLHAARRQLETDPAKVTYVLWSAWTYDYVWWQLTYLVLNPDQPGD